VCSFDLLLCEEFVMHIVLIMMKPHQLLVLMVFVANLPSCVSVHLKMRPSKYLPAIREARREAYLKQPGGWRLMDPEFWLAEKLVEEAAKQENVTSTITLEAFYKYKISQLKCRSRWMRTDTYKLYSALYCGSL